MLMSVWTREKGRCRVVQKLSKAVGGFDTTRKTITIFQVVDVIFSVELTISFEWASKMN